MSDKTFAPPEAGDLAKLIEGFEGQMDPEAMENAKKALAILEERGMPDSSTYSLNHIEAEDEDDLLLKLHLATTPPFLAYLNEEISLEEATVYVMPVMEAVLTLIMTNAFSGEEVEFPITITVE